MKNELPHLFKPLPSDQSVHRLGVVLPIPDASPRLRQCLAALCAASTTARQHGHQADIFVVIDGINADHAAVASTFAVHLVTADFSDQASARAIGARAALGAGATWLAFTESDALVAENWLIEQIAGNSELMLGEVEITDQFMCCDGDVGRSNWNDVSISTSDRSPLNFSNLGMSRTAFEMASHLGGAELRLDAGLLEQLTALELATSRCDKPLVYARMQRLEDACIDVTGEAPIKAATFPTASFSKAAALAAA